MNPVVTFLTDHAYLAALIPVANVLGRTVAVVIATWGVDDDRKADIIRAVGEAFRWGRRR